MKYKFVKLYAPDNGGAGGADPNPNPNPTPAPELTPEQMRAEVERLKAEREQAERAENERIRAEYEELKRWKATYNAGTSGGGYAPPADDPTDTRTARERELDDRYANGGAKMFYGDNPTDEQIKFCRLMAGCTGIY